MGTKNNPGEFDCYHNAGPDEPMFILLGRDRHAAVLTRVWALLRARDGEDEDKVNEALECATKMDAWADKLDKLTVWGGRPSIGVDDAAYAAKPSYRRVEPIYLAATEGLDEHPDGFDEPCQCHLCLSYGD